LASLSGDAVLVVQPAPPSTTPASPVGRGDC